MNTIIKQLNMGNIVAIPIPPPPKPEFHIDTWWEKENPNQELGRRRENKSVAAKTAYRVFKNWDDILISLQGLVNNSFYVYLECVDFNVHIYTQYMQLFMKESQLQFVTIPNNNSRSGNQTRRVKRRIIPLVQLYQNECVYLRLKALTPEIQFYYLVAFYHAYTFNGPALFTPNIGIIDLFSDEDDDAEEERVADQPAYTSNS